VGIRQKNDFKLKNAQNKKTSFKNNQKDLKRGSNFNIDKNRWFLLDLE